MQSQYTDQFFNVSPEYGFLPIHAPLAVLPTQYMPVQNLINQLPDLIKEIRKLDAGIAELPIYDVNAEQDPFVVQALFRAYAFLTSAYLLAPAHRDKQDGIYGKARNELPAQLAVPFECVAQKLAVSPWLEYHYAYSLGNYVKKNPHGDLHWQNLDMACSFTNTRDEVGFIMDHVYINEVTPDLIRSIYMYVDDQELAGVKLMYSTLLEINKRRQSMWHASNYKHYNDFRAFIMGIKGNDQVFGPGVKYLGTDNPNKYRQYRGQTGAQDDIIPTCDIFTGIINFYPQNDLTKYLQDLRSYRPKCVQNFLKDLQIEMHAKPLLEHFTQTQPEGLVYLLACIDQVYLFRNGHWQFVQKYIMANTKYPVATGGTPIVSWLPNQIQACLSAMQEVLQNIKENVLSAAEKEIYHAIKLRYTQGIELLAEQLNELNKTDYSADKVYTLNEEHDLRDDESTSK